MCVPTSQVDEVSKLRQRRGPDARDGIELVNGPERTVLGSVVDDLLGGHRPNPRELVQLLERRGVQVYARAWYSAGRSSGECLRGLPLRRHDDLLAVCDRSRQVHERECGPASWARPEW